MSDHYELIAGNVGMVHQGNDKEMAHCLFVDYVERSQSGRGRAAGEPITLLKNGEILLDFLPTQTED
jgi:hypothetical protein